MSLAVERRIATSKQAFLDHVWPVIGHYIGGGDVVSCEDPSDPLLKAFDTTSGIDAWQCRAEGMWGLASRVGSCQGRDWSTFTVRHSRASCSRTEFHKLWDAVNGDDGRAYPYWFVQAYMSSDMTRLLSAAACQTRSLLHYIRDYITDSDLLTNWQDNSRFYPVKWSDMQTAGFTVHVVRPGITEATDGR
jgi:hypothetical protein